ncbi:hypothetical protein DRJ72_14260, partial [Enterococcus faecalis]
NSGKVWTIIYCWKAQDVYFPTQLRACQLVSVAPENPFRVQGGQNPTASVVLYQPLNQIFAQVPQF